MKKKKKNKAKVVAICSFLCILLPVVSSGFNVVGSGFDLLKSLTKKDSTTDTTSFFENGGDSFVAGNDITINYGGKDESENNEPLTVENSTCVIDSFVEIKGQKYPVYYLSEQLFTAVIDFTVRNNIDSSIEVNGIFVNVGKIESLPETLNLTDSETCKGSKDFTHYYSTIEENKKTEAMFCSEDYDYNVITSAIKNQSSSKKYLKINARDFNKISLLLNTPKEGIYSFSIEVEYTHEGKRLVAKDNELQFYVLAKNTTEPNAAVSPNTFPAKDNTTSQSGQEELTASDQKSISIINGIQAPSTDFIFSHSSTSLISSKDLEILEASTTEQEHSNSQMAINEILARYGYSFNPNKSDTAQEAYDKFNGLTWYDQAQAHCPYQNANEMIAQLNSTEKENINIINNWQKEHDCYY